MFAPFIHFLFRYPACHTRKPVYMFKNYCKTAIRNLLKSRSFSIINLTGLSLSIAFCLLLFFYIRYEQSYDTFHKNKDQLYRLESAQYFASQVSKSVRSSMFSFLTRGDNADNHLIFSLMTAPDMNQAFPEIENITAFRTESSGLVKAGNFVFKESDLLYTDTNFFKTFSFHLLHGNSSTALELKDNVVLSESTAKKYFGTAAVLGKTITIKDNGKDEPFTIT